VSLRCLAIAFCLLVWQLSCTPQAARAGENVSSRIRALSRISRPARVLSFPADKSCGGFIVFDQGKEGELKFRSFKAQGTISVPPDKIAAYFPNHVFFADPHVLDKLPANAFDFIEVRYGSLQDSDEGRSDPAVATLSRFTSLVAMDLQQSELTDKAISSLGALQNLEALYLFGNMIRGKCFKELSALKKLKFLGLQGNGIEPAYTGYLLDFPALETLLLSRNQLKNEQVKVLARIKTVQNLGIQGNVGVDDAVVPALLQMKNLRHLNIQGTAISEQGQKQLSRLKLETYYCNSPSLSGKTAQAAAGKGVKGKSSGPKKSSGSEEWASLFEPISRNRKP